ncbi:MAG: NUDIX domain-containing protein [Clostridia bacterium]|nr:NUDIX domain-containing protein [Clostridia bacterium]
MHKIFGIKEEVEYLNREGAYLIPIKNGFVVVAQTPKGYFLLGGGIEKGENHKECIERECMEEAGCTVCVKEKVCSAETFIKHSTIGYFHPIQTYYLGDVLEIVAKPTANDHTLIWVEYGKLKGKMFSKMQNWALEYCYEYAINKEKIWSFEEALKTIEKEFETRYDAPNCRMLRTNLTYDGANELCVALYDDGGKIMLTDGGYTKDVFWETDHDEWKELCELGAFTFNNYRIERPFKSMQDVYDFIDFLLTLADVYCPL